MTFFIKILLGLNLTFYGLWEFFKGEKLSPLLERNFESGLKFDFLLMELFDEYGDSGLNNLLFSVDLFKAIFLDPELITIFRASFSSNAFTILSISFKD